MEVRVKKREEGFTMLKGGKGYTIADIEALPTTMILLYPRGLLMK